MGENSDIGLMKTKNKGSGKVYKMVGRTTGLTEPYVVSIIYICNKIRYKYRFSFAFLQKNRTELCVVLKKQT